VFSLKQPAGQFNGQRSQLLSFSKNVPSLQERHSDISFGGKMPLEAQILHG